MDNLALQLTDENNEQSEIFIINSDSEAERALKKIKDEKNNL